MSEVKRHTKKRTRAQIEQGRPGSEFVLASDYDALAAECERLRTKLYLAMNVPSVAAMHAYLDTECAKQNAQLGTERDAALAELAALKGGQEANWRDHSVNYAKGEKCPQTIETLQAAWGRDQELIFEQRAEIARLGQKLNQARQGMRSGFDLDAWLEFAADKQSLIDEINALREQLTAPPAQASAWPEGWKLVPVEPTPEMIKAAASAITTPDDLPPVMDGWSMSDLAFRTRYRAALAAAPTTGASDGKGGHHD